MPDHSQLSDQEAAQRRRVWLDGRRRWNRDLAVVLLRYAPEAEVTRALDLLSAGELHRLAAALAAATDLHQVARRIAADLQQHLDGRQPGPPAGHPWPSAATPTPVTQAQDR
jgi:hypothetical protein